MKRKYIFFIILVPFWVIFDQMTKSWATSRLKGSPIEIIENFFTLRYATNRGAAWGMFGNFHEDIRIPFFYLITIIATAVLIFFVRKVKADKILMPIALASIAGGMYGNFIDRVYVKFVVDFIDWHYYTSHWPTFNIADVAISIGMGFIILDWIVNREEYKEIEDLKQLEKERKKDQKKAQKEFRKSEENL